MAGDLNNPRSPAGRPGSSAEAERERARELDEQQPGGQELVSTVVQAAGELASIGLTVGGQLIKRAVQRLPKP